MCRGYIGISRIQDAVWYNVSKEWLRHCWKLPSANQPIQNQRHSANSAAHDISIGCSECPSTQWLGTWYLTWKHGRLRTYGTGTLYIVLRADTRDPLKGTTRTKNGFPLAPCTPASYEPKLPKNKSVIISLFDEGACVWFTSLMLWRICNAVHILYIYIHICVCM